MRSVSSAETEEGENSFSEQCVGLCNAAIHSNAMTSGWKVRAETRDDEHRVHAFGYLMEVALILFQNDGHTGSCDK